MNFEKFKDLLLKYGLDVRIEGKDIYFFDIVNNAKLSTCYEKSYDPYQLSSSTSISDLLDDLYFYASGEKVNYQFRIKYDEQNNLFNVYELKKCEREFVENENGVYHLNYGEPGKTYDKIINKTTTLELDYNKMKQISCISIDIYDHNESKSAEFSVGPFKREQVISYRDNNTVENEDYIYNGIYLYIEPNDKGKNIEYECSVDFEYVCKTNPIIGETLEVLNPELLEICNGVKTSDKLTRNS